MTNEQKAFNRGYNSYRMDKIEPMSPFIPEALTIEFDAGWNKAKQYYERQSNLLRSRNF